MKARALVSTPKAQRDLDWHWRVGFSNHPRDVAYCAKQFPELYPPTMRKQLAAAWRRQSARAP